MDKILQYNDSVYEIASLLIKGNWNSLICKD